MQQELCLLSIVISDFSAPELLWSVCSPRWHLFTWVTIMWLVYGQLCKWYWWFHLQIV